MSSNGDNRGDLTSAPKENFLVERSTMVLAHTSGIILTQAIGGPGTRTLARDFCARLAGSGGFLEGGSVRGLRESYLSNHLRKLSILAAFLALCSLLPMIAQKAQDNRSSTPKYDPHTETKIKGAVEEVRLPPTGSEKEIAHLLVKNGTEIDDVYLYPKSFLDEMGVGFSKGDQIAVTGSMVKHDGADLVLAREVVKGNDTLVLQDDQGNPVWSWQRKN
jgi:hypothetical protein